MPVTACTVFCGSRSGRLPAYTEAARSMGEALARHHITLVYGGGHTGLMGEVADATLAHNGTVKGIIPVFLKEREVMHDGVTNLTITEDMPSRKAMLFDQCDAYIILPGGLGTFDEFYEVLVNKQIDLHHKPIIILNVEGWANPTLAALHACVEQGFAENDIESLYHVVNTVEDVIALLQK